MRITTASTLRSFASLVCLVLVTSGCRLFSVEQPCSADTNCPEGERCVAAYCTAVAPSAGGPLVDTSEPIDDDDDDEDDAPADDAPPADDDDVVDAGVEDVVDAGDDASDAGENDAGVDDAGADDVEGDDAGVDAGAEEEVVVATGSDFTVRLLWTVDADLDLHVIQQSDDGNYCRDPRPRKPRDQGVVLSANDLTSECGGRRDCGYQACDERDGYDVDWLGDGASAPFEEAAEPVLVALNGESGDVRDGQGEPAEEINVATAPLGSYLLAAAHPSPSSGDGPVCARLKVQRQGVGEVFCRTIILDDFEWDEVAELVVTEAGVVFLPRIAQNSCVCP